MASGTRSPCVQPTHSTASAPARSISANEHVQTSVKFVNCLGISPGCVACCFSQGFQIGNQIVILSSEEIKAESRSAFGILSSEIIPAHELLPLIDNMTLDEKIT